MDGLDKIDRQVLCLFVVVVVAGGVFVSTNSYQALILSGFVFIYAIGHLGYLFYQKF